MQKINYVEMAVNFARERKLKQQQEEQTLELYKQKAKEAEQEIEEGLKQWDGINSLKYANYSPYHQLILGTRYKVSIEVGYDKTKPLEECLTFKIKKYYKDDRYWHEYSALSTQTSLTVIAQILSEDM